MNPSDTIFSVANYITLINEQLKFYKAKVIGEVTKVNIYPSGHVYFTIKDKEEGAVLDCILWKRTYALYGIRLEVGMEIVLTGNASVYAPSGRFSFIANSLELVGEGALKKAYLELRAKLEREGVFLDSRKKKIPAYPQKIGIITSKQGAVIHDFTNNITKHGFKLTMIDTRVEGQEALKGLLQALRTLKKQDLDVIVIMRGGGSLQSLIAFDNEVLVREVVSSSIPIIAAIGHHEDVPLVSLAADVMTSTPTAAANLLSTSWEKGLQEITNYSHTIVMNYQEILSDTKFSLERQQTAITEKFQKIIKVFHTASQNMNKYLSQIALSIARCNESLTRSIQHLMTHMNDSIVQERVDITQRGERVIKSYLYSLERTHHTLENQEKMITTNDPRRLLSLGYSLAQIKGKGLVKSIKDVTLGEQFDLLVTDGIIDAKVVKVTKK